MISCPSDIDNVGKGEKWTSSSERTVAAVVLAVAPRVSVCWSGSWSGSWSSCCSGSLRSYVLPLLLPPVCNRFGLSIRLLAGLVSGLARLVAWVLLASLVPVRVALIGLLLATISVVRVAVLCGCVRRVAEPVVAIVCRVGRRCFGSIRASSRQLLSYGNRFCGLGSRFSLYLCSYGGSRNFGSDCRKLYCCRRRARWCDFCSWWSRCGNSKDCCFNWGWFNRGWFDWDWSGCGWFDWDWFDWYWSGCGWFYILNVAELVKSVLSSRQVSLLTKRKVLCLC